MGYSFVHFHISAKRIQLVLNIFPIGQRQDGGVQKFLILGKHYSQISESNTVAVQPVSRLNVNCCEGSIFSNWYLPSLSR